jgi:hypothetical protein
MVASSMVNGEGNKRASRQTGKRAKGQLDVLI